MNGVQIRAARAGDADRIAFVVRRAFGGEAEVQLVRELRDEQAMVCEFVAVHEAAGIVGHVAFSRLDVVAVDSAIDAAALAPLAVLPGSQRQGAGSALVHHALEHLRHENSALAVVVGDPAYYGRFGFSALLARLLHTPYSGPALQALELAPGSLGKRNWQVTYPAAFGKLG